MADPDQDPQVSLRERVAELQAANQRLQSEVVGLQEWVQTLETLADNVAYGLLIALDAGGHVYANRRAAEITGYSVEELLRLGVAELIHPDERAAVLEKFRGRLVGEPVPDQYETVIVRKDGGSPPVEFAPRRTTWQGRAAVMVAFRDISEERQRRIGAGLQAVLDTADELMACPGTDQLLRRAVELARERLDLDRCSIFVIDGDLMRGTYGTSLQGETTDEHEYHFAAGRYWAMLRQGRRQEPVWGLLEQAYREWTGEDMGVLDTVGFTVYTLIQSPAVPIGVMFNDNAISGRPLDPTTQEILAVYCSLLGNIIERHRAEEALRETERRFREMTDLLPDIVYETDTSLRVTYANQAAFDALGYTLEDVAAGIRVTDLLSDQQAVEAETRLRLIAEAGEAEPRLYGLRRADGSYLLCELHTMAVRGPDGALVGFRGVARDIAERQRMEQAQRLAAVGELATGVAHEFNNLLAGLRMQADVADRTENQASYRLLARLVRENAMRGAHICDDLLEFARPREPKREPISLEAPIEAALAVAARQIENAGIVVTRHFESEGRRVSGDATRLQQVFLNLIINSCDAMPGGGELRLETACATGEGGREEIVATVTDTGVGIEPGALPRVFEPFFTTKGGRGQSEVHGTGLGLSVSRSIVSAHGGTIEARSALGSGTTFELRFPVYEGSTEETVSMEAAKTQRATAMPQPTGDLGWRVLVAEDEWIIRDVIRLALESEGCAVTATATSAQAAEALGVEAFDVIICDWLMPYGGGREVIAAARELPNPPPVLVVTGWSENAFDDTLKSLGVAKCLRKPFGVDDLLAALREVLGDR